MDIKSLREDLDSKKIGAVELAKHYLNRIEKYDGDLGCYLDINHDKVIEQAEKAQIIINNGEQKYLTGIPIGVKDNILTKSVRTTASSKMLENFVPDYSAHVVEEMERQGYVMIGKINMDEFAIGGTNETSYYKAAKNPFSLNNVPGGSSGGSSAAVSAELCAGALGTDTGGSITQPAAFCGITGIKPTYGTVSRYGLIPFADSLDQIGAMANSAYDCALMLSSFATYDKRDITMAKRKDLDFFKYINKSVKGLTIGIIKELMEDGQEEILNATKEVIKFYESIGAAIHEISMPHLKYGSITYKAFASAQGAINLNKYDGFKFGYKSNHGYLDKNEAIMKNRGEAFGIEVKKRALLGMYSIQSGHLKKATEMKNLIKQGYIDAFEKCDVIINPTTTCTAFELNSNGNPVDNCTVGANLSGLPSLSTPSGYDNSGMPIGVCIVGNYFQEAKMIGLADMFEKTFNKKKP